jgi:arabinogalactan oligomer/maltooligosaccharide transport system permease protein
MARSSHAQRLLFGFLFVAFFFIANTAHAAEINVWHSYRGAEQQALDELVTDWNDDHPDERVRLLAVPHEAYANKLTSAVPRGQGPDLFIFAHERIGDWAESGIIAPLDEHFSREDQDAFLPVTLEALHYDDKLYGVPLSFKTVALFYNKKLVDQPPRTTDELVALAEKHTDEEAGTYGLAYQADSFYTHAGWFFGFGGKIFNGDGSVTLDRPENARSLAFVDKLRRRELLPEEPTGALIGELFNEGRAATVIQGPWFLGEIDASIDYGVAPLPSVSETGLPATPFLTVEAALVSAEAKNPDGALAFARYLSSNKSAKFRLQRGQQLVANAAVYEDASVELPQALRAFREQSKQARPMPNQPIMRAVWEPAALAMRTVMRGSLGPKEALEKAQVRFDVITRPPPTQKNPLPYLLGFVVLLAAALGWLWLRLRRQGGIRALRKQKHAYLYLVPGGLALLLLVLVPFIVGTAVAFFSHRGGEFTFVGLSNFISIIFSQDYALGDPLSFYFTLAVTVMWTAINVLFHVTIGLTLAMLLRDPWLKLKGVYRVLLIVPWAVPSYITALIWKGMFHSQFGAINAILDAVGVEPIPWFSGFWTAFAANVTTNTWLGFPFMMVVCLGALQAVPKDLEEAAMMDGANGWTRFWRIILPQIKPALVPAVVLGSVWTFNMFNIIYLVSGGEPDGSTEILISEAYKWAFSRQEQYGYAAAYATLIFLALIAYSALTARVTGSAEDE